MTVFNKEFLSWYLITLKLKQTVDAGIPSSSRVIQAPTQDSQQQMRQSPESAWMITIREKLEIAEKDDVAGTWGKLCIYKVPKYLRDGEDNAYIPNIVSLGPYHHGKKRLRGMERHKWRAFYQILKRGHKDAKLYLDSIKELEERARECYEGRITISSNDFVEMMVLDGCFILELFLGAVEGFDKLGYSEFDPVFTRRGSMHLILRDMIMLENQIPLFVLDRLYGLQPGKPKKGFVAVFTPHIFSSLMPTVDPFAYFNPLPDHSHLHCLHVYRQSLLRRHMEPRTWIKRWSQSSSVADKTLVTDHDWRIRIKRWLHISRVADETQIIHCVTELKEAGIKFKKRKTDRFWDIKFKNGVLKIPRLLIHDGTKSLFLNLIAFEQSHLDCGNEITSYVNFMDSLINSQEDVGYLHYCGILEHWLGSDADVAALFNRLCQEVAFDIEKSYLSEVYKKVNRCYNHRWNEWRAILIHNYFSNPWAIISVVAAIILLILTAAQTFYGVYGFYSPPS